jgi:hypothetical protein
MSDEKPVDVAGNKTPITKKDVQQVRADRWHEMSVSELYDQKGILDGRLVAAAQLGNFNLLRQVQMGIDAINEVIAQKASTDTRLI